MVFYGDKQRGDYGTERSSYVPKQAHYDIAKEYGVVISPSTNKLKKLNVYKPNIAGDLVGSADKDGTLASYRRSLAKGKTRGGKYAKRMGNFDNMLKIAEIGGMYQDGTPYGDYYTYLEDPTDRYGNEVKPEVARQRYLVRHQHENKVNEKFFETIDEEDEVKQKAIDLGSPSFWADVILWGKKANEQKIVMKKDFAKLDQLSSTHAITDDFEFDSSFAKIIDGRIKKLKAFIEFSKKFEKKNEKIIKDYLKENEDELRVDTYYQDESEWFSSHTDRNWSSKFYTTKAFKNKNMEKIKQLYYSAIENTKVFERQLIFNQKILKDYNKRLDDDKLKQLGQNIATNQEIAKLAEEANEEALKKGEITGELLEDIKKKFENITEEVEKGMGEAAEYGNEGGKIYAKTIKLKTGKEINVLLNEKNTFNLNSLVLGEDGDFEGTLRDYYDDLPKAKFNLKGGEIKGAIELSPKKEYAKVLRQFLEFRTLLKKTIAEFTKKHDVEFFITDAKDVEDAFTNTEAEIKKNFKTPQRLLQAYQYLEEEADDFRDKLGQDLDGDIDDKFIAKVYPSGKIDNVKGVERLGSKDYKGAPIFIERKNIKERIKASDKKRAIAKEKAKQEAIRKAKAQAAKEKMIAWNKENRKAAKLIYQLGNIAEKLEDVWRKGRSDADDGDLYAKKSGYTLFNSLLSKTTSPLYIWADRNRDAHSNAKLPKVPKQWEKVLDNLIKAKDEINDAIKKGFKFLKKKAKGVKTINDEFDKKAKVIKDLLDEYKDVEFKITTKGATKSDDQPSWDSDSD